MEINEIDFKLIKEKAEAKVFTFTNADGTIYDLSTSTVVCKLYLDPESAPEEISCTTDVPTGKVTVPFTTTHTADTGTFEYIIEQEKSGLIIPLVRGNITMVNYVPFTETIEAFLRSELPANLTLNEDYRNQRIFYWRRFLQEAFYILDSDLNIEEKWPVEVNMLIAKLVVYDAIMLAAQGSLASFFGGDYTSTSTIGGSLAKIETGPTKVEYHSVGRGIESIFRMGPNGETPFEIIMTSLCGLASKLGVKVPMCKGNNIPIGPKFYQNTSWNYKSLLD